MLSEGTKFPSLLLSPRTCFVGAIPFYGPMSTFIVQIRACLVEPSPAQILPQAGYVTQEVSLLFLLPLSWVRLEIESFSIYELRIQISLSKMETLGDVLAPVMSVGVLLLTVMEAMNVP